MMSPFHTLNQHDRKGLLLNMALAVGAGLAIHVGAFALGWYEPDGVSRPWFAPPWWAVSTVWLVLLALMATTRWMLNEYTIVGVVPARRMVTILILSCLLWPLYSLATDNLIAGLIGTVITLVLAGAAIALVQARSRDAAALLVPVLLCLTFATLLILTEMGHI
ncbi:MAG: TspO/MBR family protein [Chloroflexota bacterium]